MSLLQALKLPPPPAASSPTAVSGKAASAKPAGAALKPEKLFQAAEAWRQAHAQADQRIAALKAAVKSHCADAPPALMREIEKGLVKLDEVMGAVDHRLADSLATAGKAGDDGTQKAELQNAKTILTEYINYVKGAPLVAHIDQNPFGVKTGLQALLSAGLSKAAKVI